MVHSGTQMFIGPCPQRDRDYMAWGSNFWKFYLIKISFTLGEPVSLVKVFIRLFRSEWIVLVFRVWTQYVDVQHLIYWQGQCVCDALFSSKTNNTPNKPKGHGWLLRNTIFVEYRLYCENYIF